MRRSTSFASAPAASGSEPELPEVNPLVERALLRATRVDERVLRTRDLPFGSSVVVAARRA